MPCCGATTDENDSPLTKGSCEEIRFDVGASRLLTRAVLTGNDVQYRDRKEAGRSSISSPLQGVARSVRGLSVRLSQTHQDNPLKASPSFPLF